jgi:hypothetical protein
VTRTEGDVLKDAAIFAEGDFAFGSAIEVIEDRFGDTALGDGAEVCDADYARRSDRALGSSHGAIPRVGSLLKQGDIITDEKPGKKFRQADGAPASSTKLISNIRPRGLLLA